MRFLLTFIIMLPLQCFATNINAKQGFITTENGSNTLIIYNSSTNVSILSDAKLDLGIKRAINNLQSDFNAVTGGTVKLINEISDNQSKLIIVGQIGTNSIIDQLVKDGKIKKDDLINKNEKFIIQSISNPFDGVDDAIVIAGSDKRGVIYGIYEFSSQIGVSPWHYWADVPVKKKESLYFIKGTYTDGEPSVKYRGIFLNDEWPSLGGWAQATFGGFNSQFYEKIFELILRLKGNFLWPAMWNSAFYDDDPLNGSLASEMGIVMSTSHHEPMSLAQKDWSRRRNGDWNYKTNSANLKKFWQLGIERSKDWEQVVTVGMRGDGDEAMEDGTNIALLENIVKDQRKIIANVTKKKAEATPQVWALYKEVQDYYDKGMRVPDDITLLFCDDNWGNVRKLPNLADKPRKGGYGMYYHFDYVGGPRNSKWINVSQVQRIWEQMNLTYRYGVDRIWVVNVGDLKPMEYPISFFMDMAWNPDKFNENNLYAHTEDWCRQQFGEKYAKESARLINLYTKYNHRVTPELLSDETFSIENYNEWENVVADYRNLLIDAMRLYNLIPDNYKDAFDQLVLYPINACSNLYEMYYAVAKNKFYVERNDIQANYWADKAKECFARDSVLENHYHEDIANGKWNHMMSQTRIGYTNWQEPKHNIMPTVEYIKSAKNENIFIEKDGYISIEVENYANKNNGSKVSWIIIPDLGKTLSGVTTTPVTENPDKNVYLEYKIESKTTGKAKLIVLTSPTLNFNASKGLRYAISINGEPEQIVNINGHYKGELGQWQAERIIKSETVHEIKNTGLNIIRIRPLEPGIVFQKLMIDMGGLKSSYLGAPQSRIK